MSNPSAPESSSASRRTPAKSLFARLGGAPAIEATVDEFYRRVLADDMLGRFFKAKTMPHLRQMQVDFFTQALGGGNVYKGKSLREAHGKMHLTMEHFNRVAGHLQDTLNHLGVDSSLVGEVMTAVGTLADEVISGDTLKGVRDAVEANKGRGHSLLGELDGLRGIVDSLQTNVFVANSDLYIVHINPRAMDTLKTIAKPIYDAFGVKLEDILNGHIHRFHRDPKRVEHILRTPGYLPHSADFTFGGITLRTRINSVVDARHDVIGYTVSWDDVTAELKQKNEVQRLTNMVEQMPTNVFLCDRDLHITYMNPAARKTMARIEPYISVRADQMVGTNIDVFHKHPEHQRRLLADPKNLPHRALITVGPEKLDLLVSAIFDASGEYVGPMLTWEIVTEKTHLEERIRETVMVVATSSSQLIQASDQMTSTAQETSAQATQVASAAEEINRSVQAVSSGIEEMNASIKEIAKNATDAARVADEAVRIAEGTNTTIGSLGLSSAEIGKVIKVITGIAQQTNLLALNATIEAARAGDAGRGFAVVANEVKELAKETARATEDIGQKIEAIQGGVKGAVDGIARISEVIHHISQVQGSIASAVEEQTVTSNEISRRVFEAAKGTDDIARSVTNVADAARIASEGAGSTRTAASDLSRMAGELQALTEKKKN
ncbi:MAG TPA: methyl-accepting chemotaxis protein [Moraxellaceae bacterium]|nr:methyl-accepting chemotaxis protein [Moraxellaceae bacterium]